MGTIHLHKYWMRLVQDRHGPSSEDPCKEKVALIEMYLEVMNTKSKESLWSVFFVYSENLSNNF